MSEESSWDAICVGAGITSLAFAAQVIRRDPEARILVLDKHIIPGGYATHFRRRRKTDAIFDCSLHKLTGTHKTKGNFYRLLADLDLLEDLELVDHPDHFSACLPNKSIDLPNEPDAAKARLLENFPEDKQGIEQFFKEVLLYGRHSYHLHQIRNGTYDVDIKELRYAHRNLKDITVAEALKERISNEYLKEILAAPSIYVGGHAEDLSYLYFLHVVYATLCVGNSYCLGTSQKLSDILTDRINKANSKVQLKTEVRKIESCQKTGGYRVESSRGDFYGKKIYINASPHYAVDKLFSEEVDLTKTRKHLQQLIPSKSTTTLYFTTDVPPEQLGFASSETMIFSYDHETCLKQRSAAKNSRRDDELEFSYWQVSVMEVTNYNSLNPSDGYVLCANVMDTVEHWPERHHKKEYRQKKARAVEIILQRLYQAKPLLKGHVLYTELASPRTYFRFTNNTDGSGYGALVEPKSSAHTFHHFFPLKNIEFLSAWVAGSGYESAFGYAEMMAGKWKPQNVTQSNS